MDGIFSDLFSPLLTLRDIYSCILTNTRFNQLLDTSTTWQIRCQFMNYPPITSNYKQSYKTGHQLAIFLGKCGMLFPLTQVFDLQNLFTLGDVSFVPPGIGLLSNMRRLNLSYGSLTSLPDEIGHLTNLHTLLVHNNELPLLNPTISYLHCLMELLS